MALRDRTGVGHVLLCCHLAAVAPGNQFLDACGRERCVEDMVPLCCTKAGTMASHLTRGQVILPSQHEGPRHEECDKRENSHGQQMIFLRTGDRQELQTPRDTSMSENIHLVPARFKSQTPYPRLCDSCDRPFTPSRERPSPPSVRSHPGQHTNRLS
ncbi:predicted protein [Pyrenophora tritici-repentis Pt-1C-BFP]|uniref:Uncharacterized protein n=1 Tax=Pyrenophora tritici-repentis (strain Pt-1C-BFP) TaxID=426418 RepID=B2W6Z9_PYRTR|nr:uncharacterized protein PTRG_05587 [Pyrenophora tritici-repentis Pt-1C-BFP]EDU48507.1 predicted protein [Pyrenophora tritici-repentis Pt-1C-BFP]